jgi:hypothetical protein
MSNTQTTLQETLPGECMDSNTEEYVGIARVLGAILALQWELATCHWVLKLFFLNAQEYNIVKCITEMCKRENDP